MPVMRQATACTVRSRRCRPSDRATGGTAPMSASTIAANDRLSVSAMPAALDTSRSRFALSARGLIEPHYFQLLPNLDVTPFAALGWNAIGRSSIDYSENAGTGDYEIGISAVYPGTSLEGRTQCDQFHRHRLSPAAERPGLPAATAAAKLLSAAASSEAVGLKKSRYFTGAGINPLPPPSRKRAVFKAPDRLLRGRNTNWRDPCPAF